MSDVDERDSIDAWMDESLGTLPDLDLEVEGIVERLQYLNKRIRRMLGTNRIVGA